MSKKSDHDLAHDFSDWMDDRLKTRQGYKTCWRGTEEEKFISWRSYCMSRFRDWGLLTNLPEKRWKRVFNEFMND